MAEARQAPATVMEFVERTLPHINEHLNWAAIKERFDPQPEGKSLGFVLLEDVDGDPRVVESFGLQIAAGPAFQLAEYPAAVASGDEEAFGMGDIVMYRDDAIEVLHPDHDLDPQTAYYQRGDVELVPTEPMREAHVWWVGCSIMEMVTEELDHLLPAVEG